MINAPKGKIDIPMKVDCEITKNWYGESVGGVSLWLYSK